MKYFATRNADSSEAETINRQVSFYKTDTFIRNKYMTYEYDLHESKEAGRAEGVKEERAKNEAANSRRADFLRSKNVPDDIIEAMLAIK